MRSVISAVLTSTLFLPASQWAEKTTTAFGLTFCVISRPIFPSLAYAGCSVLNMTSGCSTVSAFDLVFLYSSFAHAPHHVTQSILAYGSHSDWPSAQLYLGQSPKNFLIGSRRHRRGQQSLSTALHDASQSPEGWLMLMLEQFWTGFKSEFHWYSTRYLMVGPFGLYIPQNSCTTDGTDITEAEYTRNPLFSG